MQLAVCFLVAFTVAAAAQDKKADPTGTWKWTMPGRNGGPDRTNSLTLKFEGDKLTGTVSAPGRGGQATETAIADGKVSGSDISFTVTRDFGGTKVVMKYSGKLGDDTIKGKVETDRDGQTQSREWEAKREAAKAKEPAAK